MINVYILGALELCERVPPIRFLGSIPREFFNEFYALQLVKPDGKRLDPGSAICIGGNSYVLKAEDLIVNLRSDFMCFPSTECAHVVDTDIETLNGDVYTSYQIIGYIQRLCNVPSGRYYGNCYVGYHGNGSETPDQGPACEASPKDSSIPDHESECSAGYPDGSLNRSVNRDTVNSL